MSLMGLGFGIAGHGYCHMCSSNHCQHVMGVQQNMNNDQYHQMLRQMGAAQQQSISISSVGSVTTACLPIAITGTAITSEKPKKNKKLLLIRK